MIASNVTDSITMSSVIIQCWIDVIIKQVGSVAVNDSEKEIGKAIQSEPYFHFTNQMPLEKV